MDGIITYIMKALAAITSVYMVLIFIRIILSWFSGPGFARPGGLSFFLSRICDPYLNWFRRFRIFKNSPIDFTPLIALVFLSLANNVFSIWGQMGSIRFSVILNMLLLGLWSVISWVLGFFIVLLLLRMIAFLGNFNIYSPFWRFVDFIAQPLIYRISRIFFPIRNAGYLFRIIFSIAAFLVLGFLVWKIVGFVSILIMEIPL